MAYSSFHPGSAEAPEQLTREQFKAVFPAEGDFTEWKSGTGGSALQDAVVAFSNAEGGVVLIGVDDGGKIVGRERTQAVEDAIHEAVGNVVSPGRYRVGSLQVDGTEITVVSVAKRIEGFAQTSQGRVLVRRGARNESLFGKELARFVSARSVARFESADAEATLSAVDPTALEELADAFGWRDEGAVPDRLREQGLVAADDGPDRLTVAGALCLSEAPNLGKSWIDILRFAPGSNEYDRRLRIDGPLHRQVEKCTRLLMDELGTELVVRGIRRYELPRLPEVVVREGIANAVAHRSYELDRVPIRIEMRSEALRIVSPGSLPEPVTEQNIREAQAARNPVVINVLRRFGLAEDAGRGVDVMEDTMAEELLDPPRFRDMGHAVELTLPIRSAVSAEERAWVREIEQQGHIEPADRLLLIHTARGEVMTNARAREILHVAREEALAALQRLRDAGLLRQHGRRGGASYELDRTLAPPAGLRLPPEDIADLIVEMAREGPVTNARVRARTGLDRNEALRILDLLVREGRLVRRGQRRGTHYVRPGS